VHFILIGLFGIIVGLGASFSGLGGGFLMVPLLIFMGYSAQEAVGTSFLGILVISVSALAAHYRLAHVDYKTGLVLGLGGIIGAQISTGSFKKILAAILVGLAAYLFFQK
jgi:uncharacterized membrane protein YfcA